jgi:IS5 family transposase
MFFYDKYKTFNGKIRKTAHFYQYWRLLIYNPQIYTQLIFADFDQSVNLKINPENRWIKKGNVAQLLRMALSALLIQKEYGSSDEGTFMQIQENPYLQSFI